ncbi:hypothetical protein D3C78_920570 [compost metagenome]
MLTGEALLRLQQFAHARVLLGEKLLQGLDHDRRCVAQGGQFLQRQVAAHRMVGPAPSRGGSRAEQQQEKRQLHGFFDLIG